MNTQYYIEEEHHQLGPFDLISMIRKIRNGQVGRQTPVMVQGEETYRPAESIDDLADVFIEMESSVVVEEAPKVSLGFMQLAKRGAEFFAQNLIMSVYTGVFLLLAVILNTIIATVTGTGPVFIIIAGIIGYFLFSLYLMATLRKARMQLLSGHFFVNMVKRSGLHILGVSALIALPVFVVPTILASLAGPLLLALILLPGSLLMMWFFYAPFYAADHGMGTIDALSASMHAVRSIGGDNFISLYLVLFVNFIAATIPIFLLLTLPITIGALCEVYDDHFNQFNAT